jgi:hypothetical protein
MANDGPGYSFILRSGPKDRSSGTITPNVYAAPRKREQAVELGID